MVLFLNKDQRTLKKDPETNETENNLALRLLSYYIIYISIIIIFIKFVFVLLLYRGNKIIVKKENNI